MHTEWRGGSRTLAALVLAVGCCGLLICICGTDLKLARRAIAAGPTSRTGDGAAATSYTALLAALTHQAHTLELLQRQLAALNNSMHSVLAASAGSGRQQHQQKRRQPPETAFGAEHQQAQAKAKATCNAADTPEVQLPAPDRLVAPVVIVARDRVHYLGRCLMTVLRYWSEDASNAEKFPLFVSIDGGHPSTSLFAGALNHAANVRVIHSQGGPRSTRCHLQDGQCNLSLRYKMLLQLFFECHKVPRLIFLEEDLDIAPDFFSFFESLAPLLQQDPTLWCVSAWNDLGQRGRVSNTTHLLRTDIIPGLGWMLSAEVGNELWPQWPNLYWDDWMQQPSIRKGRQCVFPEVSRTHAFGSAGTSGGGNLFNKYLATMALNKEQVEWSKQDFDYLLSITYKQLMQGWVSKAQQIQRGELQTYCSPDQPQEGGGDLLVRYTSKEDYSAVLEMLLPGVKGAPAHASYNGVSVVRCHGRRLFLAPRLLSFAGDEAHPTNGWGAVKWRIDTV